MLSQSQRAAILELNTQAVPASSPRPVPCRPAAHLLKPRKGARKGYPVCGQAG